MTVQANELRHWLLGLVAFIAIAGAGTALMLAARPFVGLQDAALLLIAAVVLVEVIRRSRAPRKQ